MFKLKVNKSHVKMSRLFEIAQTLEKQFNFILSVSIDNVNLEEIFWNMNQS